MKLMTKELEQLFKATGQQENNPLVIAKFFNAGGAGTWYATEYDPADQTFYGYVTGLAEDERGRFSLAELQSYKGPFGLGIERDINFKSQKFYDLFPKLKPDANN